MSRKLKDHINYIAFLRGINVSGQKLIKMTELAGIIKDMGFDKVRTYIQSGNVIFSTNERDCARLEDKLQKGLKKALGYEVTVIVRSSENIEDLVKSDPLKKFHNRDDAKPYITFSKSEPQVIPRLPVKSPKDGVEILGMKKGNVFCLSCEIKNGRWGFPNLFVEKLFKTPATTRNWNTVTKILEMANS